MSEKNGFEIKDCPVKQGNRSKNSTLVEALLKVPDGKAICVSFSRFSSSPAISIRNYLRGRTDRKLHVHRLPDGWYIWLEPEQKESPE